jgi:hypothetical protein
VVSSGLDRIGLEWGVGQQPVACELPGVVVPRCCELVLQGQHRELGSASGVARLACSAFALEEHHSSSAVAFGDRSALEPDQVSETASDRGLCFDLAQ